jgi:hypothetical protein
VKTQPIKWEIPRDITLSKMHNRRSYFGTSGTQNISKSKKQCISNCKIGRPPTTLLTYPSMPRLKQSTTKKETNKQTNNNIFCLACLVPSASIFDQLTFPDHAHDKFNQLKYQKCPFKFMKFIGSQKPC